MLWLCCSYSLYALCTLALPYFLAYFLSPPLHRSVAGGAAAGHHKATDRRGQKYCLPLWENSALSYPLRPTDCQSTALQEYLHSHILAGYCLCVGTAHTPSDATPWSQLDSLANPNILLRACCLLHSYIYTRSFPYAIVCGCDRAEGREGERERGREGGSPSSPLGRNGARC